MVYLHFGGKFSIHRKHPIHQAASQMIFLWGLSTKDYFSVHNKLNLISNLSFSLIFALYSHVNKIISQMVLSYPKYVCSLHPYCIAQTKSDLSVGIKGWSRRQIVFIIFITIIQYTNKKILMCYSVSSFSSKVNILHLASNL